MKRPQTVGIVGGGQLAVMMIEAARRLGLETRVLASSPDEVAARRWSDFELGDARDVQDLRRFAATCDVITFDHELVNSFALAVLEDEGVTVRPGASALAVATDKHRQLLLFSEQKLPVPETVVVHDAEEAISASRSFINGAVLKAATGGYDGRGVLLQPDGETIRKWYPVRRTPVLVQPLVPIDAECAVQIVRAPNGEIVTYPIVRTVQENGMCSVVHVPSGLTQEIEEQAVAIACVIAEVIGVVGILAVEFFISGGKLLLNEIAARPHNSGHITLESSRTSQFENHMRAVTGHPLGATDLIFPAAAMVNIVGSCEGPHSYGLLPSDVAVHLYGKAPRPGRKLGHITAVDSDVDRAIQRATTGLEKVMKGSLAS
ncbi:MAG: 5-(carboxyamino)imidazole ribonucleotide synthase [Actinomycetes bacterium]